MTVSVPRAAGLPAARVNRAARKLVGQALHCERAVDRQRGSRGKRRVARQRDRPVDKPRATERGRADGNGPVPVAEPAVLLTSSVPSETVVPPPQTPAPAKTSVPAPDFANKLAPASIAASASVLPWPTLTDALPVKFTVVCTVFVPVQLLEMPPAPTASVKPLPLMVQPAEVRAGDDALAGVDAADDAVGHIGVDVIDEPRQRRTPGPG